MTEILRRLLFLPPEASQMAMRVDRLHFFVILTTIFASTVIGVAAVYFMVRYRRRHADQTTPHIEAPRWLEAAMVVLPLALFLLWFRIGFAQFVDMSTPPHNAMDVYVTGKQWMWKFAYPKGPSGIAVLRVPVNRPVRLLLTSRDVIHGFFVPAFRLKQDALPGRYTQAWFEPTMTGTFPIYCSQYCGTSHSTMRATVEVMPQAEFDRWVATPGNEMGPTAPTPSGSMTAVGEQVAVREGCFRCHSIDGSVGSGPSWLGLYGRRTRLSDGTTVLADPAYLTESMMEPMAKVVAGFTPNMPSYEGKVNGPEAAALVEYIRSLGAHP